jgi:hypothetical protein
LTVTDLLDVFQVMGASQFFITGGVREMKISYRELATAQQACT